METLFDERALCAWEDRQRHIHLIQIAAKRPRAIFADDNHPEAIRDRIIALQLLLADAGF